jgi:GNAT superfamily N-acetyltransferase
MALDWVRDKTLRDGSVLNVKLGTIGLPEMVPALDELLAESGFPDLDIIFRILRWTEDHGSVQRHFFAYRNGELAGFLRYDASARVPCVCSLGYVFTAERHRRLGIAKSLLQVAIDDFRSLGGRALFLSGTESIYEQVGFRPIHGHIMRCVPDGDHDAFNAFYFGGRPVAGVRALTWADWAMAAMLYGQPTELHVRDYGIRLYSGPGHEVVRFQSVVPLLMRSQEAGTGCTKVAEDSLGHLVGIGTLVRRQNQLPLLDFHVHPTSEKAAEPLLAGLLSEAGGSAEMKIAVADESKLDLARAAGANAVLESMEETSPSRRETIVTLLLGGKA